MNIRLLDTVKGTIKVLNSPFDPYWWEDGNGSCDCNRVTAFFKDQPFPYYCFGATRYLVLYSDDPGFSFDRYNQNYPPALIERYRSFSGPPINSWEEALT